MDMARLPANKNSVVRGHYCFILQLLDRENGAKMEAMRCKSVRKITLCEIEIKGLKDTRIATKNIHRFNKLSWRSPGC